MNSSFNYVFEKGELLDSILSVYKRICWLMKSQAVCEEFA